MAEREITVDTPNGPMDVFVVQGDEGGEQPLVVQIPDASGVREELRDIAREYSKAGVAVALLDVFHNIDKSEMPPRVSPDSPDADENRKARMAVLGKLKDDMIIADARAAFEALAGKDGISARPGGVVGYCLGGRAVIRVMGAMPDQVKAGVGLHPSRTVTDGPDSPHLDIAKFASDAEVYFGCGSDDHATPPDVLETLESALQDAGVRYEIDVTPGAVHGFTMKSNPSAYNEDADRLHYEHAAEVFGRLSASAAV